MTEVANLPLDADRTCVRKVQFPSRSQPRSTRAGVRGETLAQKPTNAGRADDEVGRRHSPSLARPPLVTSHMTPSAVQTGMVHLAPSGRLRRAHLDISHRLLLSLAFWSHFLLRGGSRCGRNRRRRQFGCRGGAGEHNRVHDMGKQRPWTIEEM